MLKLSTKCLSLKLVPSPYLSGPRLDSSEGFQQSGNSLAEIFPPAPPLVTHVLKMAVVQFTLYNFVIMLFIVILCTE